MSRRNWVQLSFSDYRGLPRGSILGKSDLDLLSQYATLRTSYGCRPSSTRISVAGNSGWPFWFKHCSQLFTRLCHSSRTDLAWTLRKRLRSVTSLPRRRQFDWTAVSRMDQWFDRYSRLERKLKLFLKTFSNWFAGSYDLSFYIAGIFIILSGAILVLLPAFQHIKSRMSVNIRADSLETGMLAKVENQQGRSTFIRTKESVRLGPSDKTISSTPI